MLRGAALLTALSCVLLAFLAADGVRAGSPTTTIQPNWSNISNTTLITVPDVRNRVWGREMGQSNRSRDFDHKDDKHKPVYTLSTSVVKLRVVVVGEGMGLHVCCTYSLYARFTQY